MQKFLDTEMEKKLFTLSLVLLWSNLASSHDWAPQYHLFPQKGWMNDPNGLIYYNGYYHAFYQHYPHAPHWGPMHWGHARSTDMLSWEHLPIALAPSIPEDIDGIFSGSAVTDNKNLTVIYTCVSGDHQRQCLATSSDGISFVKEGLVIPREGNNLNFRDPKVWWQENSWYVVIGSKTNDDKGIVILYKSSDLRSWKFEGVLAQADDKHGNMWECPDFFKLGDNHILLVSPQGMQPDGYDYLNEDQTGYFVGTWTLGNDYKIEKEFREIDHGHDFYASQTFLAPDGRRILIGWLSMWGAKFPEASDEWAGMLTLPRELTLSSSGDLEIRPIREIQKRRTNSTLQLSNYILKDNTYKVTLNRSSAELMVDFNLSNCTADLFGLKIGNSLNSDAGVKIYVNGTSNSRLFLERYYPAQNIDSSTRSALIKYNGILTLDIFLDKSSIEVFVNDGQAVLSSRIYPDDTELIFSLFQIGGGTVTVSRFETWYL